MPSFYDGRNQNGVIKKFYPDFYRFYLSQHANKICRLLHVVGTSLLLILTGYVLATGKTHLLWWVPVLGYGFAWIGHFVFEKNRPATFKQPFFSLMGDFVMWYEVVTFQRDLTSTKV